MKSKDLYNSIYTQIQHIYPDVEAKNIATLLLEEFLEINQRDLVINKTIGFDSVVNDKLNNALTRLKKNEPIQYILRKAHFYGRYFKVNPNVLIPRKETEELVHYILQDHPNFDGSILDIGTGSGCIAITLRIELAKSTLEAIDINDATLDVARENASRLNGTVNFHQLDILGEKQLPDTYDIIVSNPPYVMNKEKKQMQENVLMHEPSLALFIEDSTPLVFYNAIINKATRSLRPAGMLYFEINEQFGREIVKAMEDIGFRDLTIIKDMQGKNRIVKGRLSPIGSPFPMTESTLPQ